MKKIIYAFVVIAAFLFSANIYAQNEKVEGLWKTIDDETGQPKSIVKVYVKDGKVFGDIVKLFRKQGEDPDPVCDKCDDDDSRKNKKILGMTIITDMEKGDDGVWEDGEILDPKKGKVYDCKLWVENGKLQVRGYVLFFHRTQEWLKYEGEI
ncbi:MAG: DUF2147 domain-containing protein [Ignavibacteriae bacterium]|nr:DUF2147 domain-containing protein [Ignavibacteriota bacterium]